MAEEAAVDIAVVAAEEVIAAEVEATISAGVEEGLATELEGEFNIYLNPEVDSLKGRVGQSIRSLDPILGQDMTDIIAQDLVGMEFSDFLADTLGSDDFASYLNNYGSKTPKPVTLVARSEPLSEDSTVSDNNNRKIAQGMAADLKVSAIAEASAKARPIAAKDIILPGVKKALNDAGHDTKYHYLKDKKAKIMEIALIPIYGTARSISMLTHLKKDATAHFHSKAQHNVAALLHSQDFKDRIERCYSLSLKQYMRSDAWKSKLDKAGKEYKEKTEGTNGAQ